MVRQALRRAERSGLPGEHHFFIAFLTEYPGVQVSDRLRQRYPKEMTIVLQHQYWDLVIGPEVFEVTVSFNKQQERIKVPFAALSAFVDPSVRFGLQFERKDKDRTVDKAEATPPPSSLPAPDTRPPLAAPQGSEAKPEAGDTQAAKSAETKPENEASKVVKLDHFRKK